MFNSQNSKPTKKEFRPEKYKIVGKSKKAINWLFLILSEIASNPMNIPTNEMNKPKNPVNRKDIIKTKINTPRFSFL